jgi:hypothetical protein
MVLRCDVAIQLFLIAAEEEDSLERSLVVELLQDGLSVVFYGHVLRSSSYLLLLQEDGFHDLADVGKAKDQGDLGTRDARAHGARHLDG